MDDGWTTVRRNYRGGQRPPYFHGGTRRDGDRYGGRARAPSPSFRRGNNFRNPIRPVPPPRAAQFAGPRFRSYSEVVRNGLPRQVRDTFTTGQGDYRGTTWQPADPQLGKLIRRIYAVIKTVHHLQNVAPKPGNPEPRMIARMVEVLARMIKPAAPTRDTADLITGNAKNWGYNTCLILAEHYERCLEEVLEGIDDLLTPDWKTAFEVAVRWARRNFQRISQDAIDHAEALITARGEPEQPPPRPRVKAGNQVSFRETVTRTGTPPPAETPLRAKKRQLPETAPPPLTQRVRKPRTVGGVILNRFISPEASEEEEDDDGMEIRVLEQSIEEQANSVTSSSPTRTPQAPTRIVAQVHQVHHVSPSLPSSPEVEQEAEGIVPETEEEEQEEIFQESFELFTHPEPEKFRVNRHQNTQKKLTDWNFSAQKKWLIVGDSTLCSFPAFYCKDLQVESFPGGHFRHGQALMEKTTAPSSLVVEKIILGFGINGRGNKLRETTMKYVQGIMRSTKRKFPYAEIWVPLVNYSDALPEEEKDNLEALNNYIIRNMPHIDKLPADQFQTEEDDVHWTAETGDAMFLHWMSYLNFGSP